MRTSSWITDSCDVRRVVVVAWDSSDRRRRLPPDWEALRRAALIRDDGECQWVEGGVLCLRPATDVDHVQPSGPDVLTNLQSLCGEHHARKSGREGNAAMRAKRRQISERLRKPPEKHPGMP